MSYPAAGVTHGSGGGPPTCPSWQAGLWGGWSRRLGVTAFWRERGIAPGKSTGVIMTKRPSDLQARAALCHRAHQPQGAAQRLTNSETPDLLC